MRLIFNTATHRISVPDGAIVNGPARVVDTADFIERMPDAAIDKLVGDARPGIKAFVFRLQTSRSVNLDDARLNDALDRMVAAGILTVPERDALTA